MISSLIKNSFMKKLMLILPLLVLGFTSMSCNNDDEGGSNNVDVIVGAWKISSIVINDNDIYPLLVLQGFCELNNVTYFNNDYSLKMTTSQENTEGNCEAGADVTGTWSKEGNVYTITMEGESQTVTPEFTNNNNKFTVAQEFEGQIAMVTFTRQ